MSRSRLVVLLGPPLLIVLASAAASTAFGGGAAATRAAPPPGPLAACRGAAGPSDAIARPGWANPGAAWWRTAPRLDAAGVLTGWSLELGLGNVVASTAQLPVESAVSGPDRGQVVVATDDGRRSEVREVDVAARCQWTIDIGAAIARQAVTDQVRDGILVHLLERDTRADLGTWHVDPDGGRSLVLGPIPPETLAAAGIDRVWTTNLASTGDGWRLAVQSCHPDGCVTRVVDRATGVVSTTSGAQGDVIGFSGNELVTMAACHGLPCGVLAWGADGRSRALADGVIGAAITARGTVVIAVPSGDEVSSIAIDPATNLRSPLAALAAETVPMRLAGAMAGLETGPDAIGLIGPSGNPTSLEVRP